MALPKTLARLVLCYQICSEKSSLIVFHRAAYILHIAKAKEGRTILYDIGIKFNEGIDIAKDAATPQNASGQLGKISTPSIKFLPQTSEKSNSQNEILLQKKYTAKICC